MKKGDSSPTHKKLPLDHLPFLGRGVAGPYIPKLNRSPTYTLTHSLAYSLAEERITVIITTMVSPDLHVGQKIALFNQSRSLPDRRDHV